MQAKPFPADFAQAGGADERNLNRLYPDGGVRVSALNRAVATFE
jgi:hypothetical protein